MENFDLIRVFDTDALDNNVKKTLKKFHFLQPIIYII